MANDKDTGLISVRAQKTLIERGRQIASRRGMNLSVMMRMLLIDEVARIEALEKASASR
jgi:antitoxin component of RelBE/YafQ-DinJ toxin-antitoxin module